MPKPLILVERISLGPGSPVRCGRDDGVVGEATHSTGMGNRLKPHGEIAAWASGRVKDALFGAPLRGEGFALVLEQPRSPSNPGRRGFKG
jgi:hypothetical protein